MGAGTILTSLASIKQWLNIASSNTDADALLTRLNKAASAFVLNYIDRDTLELTQFEEIVDGYGQPYLTFRNNPVYDVQAVSFFGTPQLAASGNGFTSPFSGGWSLGGDYSETGFRRLNFFGTYTPRAKSSIGIRYRAGYIQIDEAWTIPGTPYQVTVNGYWLADFSVTYASTGIALTKVSASPTVGQYSVADGVYTFAAADTGVGVLISYSYVPSDLQDAVIELVGERYKYRDRIGYKSKTLGGQETVVFDTKSMPAHVKDMLQPFKKVVPQ